MTAAEDREAAHGLIRMADQVDGNTPDGHQARMEYLTEAQVHATLACAAATAEAGPQHETICPSCGAHIRARMADAGGARVLINADVIVATEGRREELST